MIRFLLTLLIFSFGCGGYYDDNFNIGKVENITKYASTLDADAGIVEIAEIAEIIFSIFIK